MWDLCVLSWTRVLPDCDASVSDAPGGPGPVGPGPGPVGPGPPLLRPSWGRGHGKNEGQQTPRKVQPNGSSHTNIRLWDFSLHLLHYLQGNHY